MFPSLPSDSSSFRLPLTSRGLFSRFEHEAPDNVFLLIEWLGASSSLSSSDVTYFASINNLFASFARPTPSLILAHAINKSLLYCRWASLGSMPTSHSNGSKVCKYRISLSHLSFPLYPSVDGHKHWILKLLIFNPRWLFFMDLKRNRE